MASASNAEAFRFLSNVKRQSAPPRCHPFTIVLMVLALGMLFIGLTMTIIAHWPGASTIGENPLKIAGPVLLAVGALLVLIGMIAICCVNSRERKKWRKLVHNHLESRNQSQAADRSQFTDKPSFEIRNQPQTSAVPPNWGENPDSFQGKPGSNSDSDYYKGGRYANVDNNGDPSQFSSFDGSGPGDDDMGIAEPKRPQKKRRAAPPAGANLLSDTSADQSSEGGAFGGMATTTTTTTTTTVTKRTGENGQTSEERTTKTSTKKTRQPLDDSDASASFSDGRGGKSAAAAGGRGGIQPPPSPGESKMLRVHVKALPGASVHIHPSGSPATQPRKAFSPSTTSGETDI